jgi:hypothetical protein
MKKKILNDMKVVIIILIGVTILFAILGAFNISMKENMDNEEPQCYPNHVVDHDYASFNEKEEDDRYILKTKIVPPKGTACPTEISSHASKYLNEKGKTTELELSQSESQSVNSTSTSSVSNTSNLTQNITENGSKNTPSPSESKSSTPETIENKNNDNKSNISNNTCPPCPACERCPEPAFDCKKVPNYRSPSIGQYLPMPILNDFSKF